MQVFFFLHLTYFNVLAFIQNSIDLGVSLTGSAIFTPSYKSMIKFLNTAYYIICPFNT